MVTDISRVACDRSGSTIEVATFKLSKVNHNFNHEYLSNSNVTENICNCIMIKTVPSAGMG